MDFFFIILLIIETALLFVISIIAIFQLFSFKKYKLKMQHQSIFEKKLNELIENLQGGIITCRVFPETKELKINYMSEGWERLTGYSYQDMLELYKLNPQMLILPDDRKRMNEKYSEQILNNKEYHLQYRILHKNGSVRWILDHGIVTLDENNNLENQSILTDITDLKQREELLRVSEERFRISILASNTAVYEFDIKKMYYSYFENTDKAFGISCEQLQKLFNDTANAKTAEEQYESYKKIAHPDDFSIIMKSSSVLIDTGECELEFRLLVNDNYIWCKLHKKLIKNEFNQPIKIIGSLININENKRREAELAKKIQIEPFTGLFNKPAAKSIISDYLAAHPTTIRSILLIDIDDFKKINDTFGHTFGDMVLVDIATRLKTILTHGEIVARIGGDEFLAFLPDIKNEQSALAIAQTICKSLRLTYNTTLGNFKISCSIGISCSQSDDYDKLIEHADMAMYDAKQRGKNQLILFDNNKTYNYIKSTQNNDLLTSTMSAAEMVFDLLYSASDFIGSVNMALSFLCNSFGFNYAYIFETEEGKFIAHNTFEWASNCESTLVPSIEPLNFEANPDYFKYYENNKYYYIDDISVFDEYSRKLLQNHNVDSILHVPLIQGKKICGLVGFGSEAKQPQLAEDNITKLLYATRILSTFISKQRVEEKIFRASKNKAHAMDNLPVYVYVIDDERNLLFMNKLVINAKLEAKIGDKCYEKFMCCSSICEDCPAKKCGDKTASSKMVNLIGMSLVSTAQKIDWDGISAYLITCQDISEFN